MNWSERRARFRAILDGDRCVHPGSVFDPISARIAEDLGFEVGMFAGSVGSMTVLGAPDLIVLTLTEFAAQANRICRAGDLALLVDADHGYGNALNVKRTVEELETAGVAALTIEDTDLPGTGAYDFELAVARIEAAAEAARSLDDDFVLVARADGVLNHSYELDEGIRRLQDYSLPDPYEARNAE